VVLISNGTDNEYSMTTGFVSSAVTYILEPSGLKVIPLRCLVSDEISFSCLNSKKAKELEQKKNI